MRSCSWFLSCIKWNMLTTVLYINKLCFSPQWRSLLYCHLRATEQFQQVLTSASNPRPTTMWQLVGPSNTLSGWVSGECGGGGGSCKALIEADPLWFTIVCLGSTNNLCLGQRLKHVKPLEMTYKVASVIGMTFLYDAGYSVVLLRPKNEVKLPTQSAEKSICMGKWAVPKWGIYFHPLLVLAHVPEFFSQCGQFRSSGKITSGTQRTRGRGRN